MPQYPGIPQGVAYEVWRLNRSLKWNHHSTHKSLQQAESRADILIPPTIATAIRITESTVLPASVKPTIDPWTPTTPKTP